MGSYGDDQWLEELNRTHLERLRTSAARWEAEKREDLKKQFNVPDEFLDLAVKIWFDGKED